VGAGGQRLSRHREIVAGAGSGRMTKLEWETPAAFVRDGRGFGACNVGARRGQILARYQLPNGQQILSEGGATPVVGLPWVWARGFVAAERPKEEPSQRRNCAGLMPSGRGKRRP